MTVQVLGKHMILEYMRLQGLLYGFEDNASCQGLNEDTLSNNG